MSVWAFLDESGDPNLDGGSTHFSVCAVVVPEDSLHERRAAVEAVRRKYFQAGPIKSRAVGRNLERRLKALRALATTDCRIAGLLVDKRRLDRESGLRFRRSFVKYISHSIYERLFRAYRVLNVRADQHGRADFMESFQSYLQRRHKQVDLFGVTPTIEFVDSSSEVLVQAADLVAGSIRIAYGDEVTDEVARAILSCIKPMSLGIHDWPPMGRTVSAFPESIPSQATEDDDFVCGVAKRSAYQFLVANEDTQDEQVLMQIETVRALLSALQFEDSPYLHGEAIAEHLRDLGFASCTHESVRRAVIAPLRDREVLIVSSSRGYSLAAGTKDLETHLKRMEDEVRPIFRRLQMLCSTLKMASVGSVDPLEPERFRYLREMLERHHDFEHDESRRFRAANEDDA